MNNMLDDLAHGFSENNSEMFDSVYADFEKNASVTAGEQERILSSVMRKAGFDMKENITLKKTRKISKRMVGIVIAAAVMIIGTVTTAAYYAGYRLEDGQIIRKFYGENAETWLDSSGLNEKQAGQNGHFDVTMYSPVSDGMYCNTLWCIEALDDTAKEQLGNTITINIQAYYADTGEEINMSGSSSWWNESLNSDTYRYFSHSIPLAGIDISRDIEFRIDNFMTFDSMVPADELTDGLKFIVNASPNVETKIIANEKGTEFWLSTLEAVHILGANEEYPDKIQKVCLIKSDGSYEPVYEWGWTCGNAIGETKITEPMLIISFREMFDISDVIGIKIDDDIYLEVNK